MILTRNYKFLVKKSLLLGISLLIFQFETLEAGENGLPLVPLPSVSDFTGGGGWGVALGTGIEYESAYDGSDDYELEFDPAGAIPILLDF